jgi:hypothetical protein
MCVPFLYGRAGRLTAENGGFRPGQCEVGLGVNYARTDLPEVVTVDYCEQVLAAPVVTQNSWQEVDGKITRTYALAVPLGLGRVAVSKAEAPHLFVDMGSRG